MSKTTKKKYVTKAVLEEVVEPTGDQQIVRVLCGRGNNLHEVESCSGERFLVSMPTKYRRNVWIKRGDFVIVDPILEGHKVQAEIIHILYPMQIRELKTMKKWPQEFNDDNRTPAISKQSCDHKEKSHKPNERSLDPYEQSCDPDKQSCDSDEQSCDSDEDIFVNPNRQQTNSMLEFTSSDTD